ncbi:hypothetical protein [Pantoea agglomerans]|uniref:hypothetical protein n=1 Tax=Enterobacter agglomerans TaxID=549 RepID=UPI0034CD1089
MFYLYESKIISVFFMLALVGLLALTKTTQNRGVGFKSANSVAWTFMHVILIELKGFFFIGFALSAFAMIYWMN